MVLRRKLLVLDQSQARAKRGERKFLRFLDIARGSAGALQYRLEAAVDCRAIGHDEGSDPSHREAEVAKMIHNLIRGIKADLNDANDSPPS